MASQDSAPWALLKPFAHASTVFVGINMAATSIIFIPALLRITDTKQGRPTAAKLFAGVNELSMKYNIPLEVFSMLSYGAFAYKSYQRNGIEACKGWLAAVGIIGSIFPLKNMSMAPFAKTIAVEGAQGSELRGPLKKWSLLNLVRSGLVLGAATVAVVFGES